MRSSAQSRLRQIMSERNLKQRDILELSQPFQKKYGIKMGKSALSQYVNGKSSPDQNKLFLLGTTLGVSEAWLMGLDVPKEREGNFQASGIVKVLSDDSDELSLMISKMAKLDSRDLKVVNDLIDSLLITKD